MFKLFARFKRNDKNTTSPNKIHYSTSADPWANLGWKVPEPALRREWPYGTQTIDLRTGEPVYREHLYDGATVDPFQHPGETLDLATGQLFKRERLYDGIVNNSGRCTY